MITPQQTFARQLHAKGWLDVVDSALFREAAAAALLQMQLNTPWPATLGDASAYQYRLAGAKEYLRLLMALTEPAAPAGRAVAQNLDHGV